jgi:hypothetical protein
MQQILVALIFCGAVIYLAKVVYNHFTTKANCSSGCGKCNTLDISKIEKQFKANSLMSDVKPKP